LDLDLTIVGNRLTCWRHHFVNANLAKVHEFALIDEGKLVLPQ